MMNITECSKQLQVLTKAHAHYSMSLEDYLRDRKVLLDRLDLNVNGITAKQIELGQEPVLETKLDTHASDDRLDITQPYFAGKIDQCMSFIKGSNN